MNRNISYPQDHEIKLYLDLIEYQYNNTTEQIDYFKECFEVDDIEENIIFATNVNKAIKSMMTDLIILTRALRDKLENS